MKQQKGRPGGVSPARDPRPGKLARAAPPPCPRRALTTGSDPDLLGRAAIARRPLTPELPRRYLLGGAGLAGNLRGIWLKIQPPPTPLRARLLRRPDPARAANATGSFPLYYLARRESAAPQSLGAGPAAAQPCRPPSCRCGRWTRAQAANAAKELQAAQSSRPVSAAREPAAGQRELSKVGLCPVADLYICSSSIISETLDHTAYPRVCASVQVNEAEEVGTGVFTLLLPPFSSLRWPS